MMSPEDLTVRETQEAEEYHLTPAQWIVLKARFTQEVRVKILDEVKANYKGEYERELRPQIQAEIGAEERKKAEAELGEKMRQKAREDLLKDKASARERQAVRAFAREVELDALTNARAASTSADSLERNYTWQMVFRRPLFHGLLFGFVPAAYELWQRFGPDPLRLASILGPWFIAFIVVAVINSDFRTLRLEAIRKHRKIGGAFAKIAEQAKRLRMVESQSELSRRELREALDSLARAKDSADHDFTPSLDTLDESRKKIRDLLITETETSEFLRVGPDEQPAEDASEPDRASNHA